MTMTTTMRRKMKHHKKKKRQSRDVDGPPCKACRHVHYGRTGGCTKAGCGCHVPLDESRAEMDEFRKEFFRKMKKMDKEKK
jgi:hypothetical protein